eukprot:1805300-Pyramimonas_sp.AAC.1
MEWLSSNALASAPGTASAHTWSVTCGGPGQPHDQSYETTTARSVVQDDHRTISHTRRPPHDRSSYKTTTARSVIQDDHRTISRTRGPPHDQ